MTFFYRPRRFTQVPFSYELRNGDVVSILTGDEGKPATDWMRYAKSRSTRAKLRSYFRDKQNESLREAGKILLLDYLLMHGPLIDRSSFLPEGTETPQTLEEVEAVLPGKTRFDDIDDLLIAIGKKHDRAFLHAIVSKLFLVPQSVLVEAERDRASLLPNTVSSAVYESRKLANEFAASLDTYTATPELSRASSPSVKDTLNNVFSENEADAAEYADPEHLCNECLPVLGDEIVGTKPEGKSDAPITVHRIGCPHAQHAINSASASRVQVPDSHRIDSVSLRRLKTGRSALTVPELPVKLQWSDFSLIDDEVLFLTEIVVVAEDRKLLLADCSEIVSELSVIVKTGSVTTREHATLEFLVQVRSLEATQKLMDALSQVRSVMSVERRVRIFGVFWSCLRCNTI